MAVVKEMTETQMTNAICKFLSLQYPNVEYRTDKDGQNASKTALWAKGKQKGKTGFPDLIVKEKRKGFGGLVLELKRDGEVVYKKDGTLRAGEHLKEQAEWLKWFSELGCKSQFSIGFDETIRVINNYLK